MKKYFLVIGLAVVMTGSYSCKGKNKDAGTTNEPTTTTQTAPPPAPVVISKDDSLRRGVEDAIKDFPGVNAAVNDGVITLTGNIQRSRFPTLKQSLDALRPRQVVNNLQYQ